MDGWDAYLAHNQITGVQVESLAIHILRRKLGDVGIQVALTGSGDDGVDNGRAAGLRLTQALVRTHQLTQLLQALVEAGVLGGGRQVGDGAV